MKDEIFDKIEKMNKQEIEIFVNHLFDEILEHAKEAKENAESFKKEGNTICELQYIQELRAYCRLVAYTKGYLGLKKEGE